MIVVTGSAGFIASCLVAKLNERGFDHLVLVDDFSRADKEANWTNKKFEHKTDRKEFIDWFNRNHTLVDFVFHLGARTDTTEFDSKIFEELNFNYSKSVWNICTTYNIPLIYASSAATYGDGEFGYKDDNVFIPGLKPLNAYGESKNEFDKWVLQQTKKPTKWYGLKFFNVYGPNEYHKGRMASVLYHAYRQISETGKIKLFKSHRSDYKDGEQMRDFIYVKDVVSVMMELFKKTIESGIYNLGTGKARSFNDLAKAVFAAMNLPVQIEYIDIPADIRDKYQYYTEAVMRKLSLAGCPMSFYPLEEGIKDYVQGYLQKNFANL